MGVEDASTAARIRPWSTREFAIRTSVCAPGSMSSSLGRRFSPIPPLRSSTVCGRPAARAPPRSTPSALASPRSREPGSHVGSAQRCWRHSDIGPARGIVVTPALKEWSAAVHALLDGRQTVLLRKGGIGEKREHQRFLSATTQGRRACAQRGWRQPRGADGAVGRLLVIATAGDREPYRRYRRVGVDLESRSSSRPSAAALLIAGGAVGT